MQAASDGAVMPPNSVCDTAKNSFTNPISGVASGNQACQWYKPATVPPTPSVFPNPNTYFVGLDVSLFGQPMCVNTAAHSGGDATQTWVNVLNGNFAGCDDLGADSRTAQADA